MDFSSGRVSVLSATPKRISSNNSRNKGKQNKNKRRSIQRQIYSSNPPRCNKIAYNNNNNNNNNSRCGYGSNYSNNSNNSDDFDDDYEWNNNYYNNNNNNFTYPLIPMSPYPPWINAMYPVNAGGPFAPICNDNGASMPIPISMVPTPSWFPLAGSEYPVACPMLTSSGPMYSSSCAGPPLMLPAPQAVLPNAIPVMGQTCSRFIPY